MKKFKTLTVFSTLFATLAFLSACNTVDGVGKDVSAGGQAIQKSAEKTRL